MTLKNTIILLTFSSLLWGNSLEKEIHSSFLNTPKKQGCNALNIFKENLQISTIKKHPSEKLFTTNISEKLKNIQIRINEKNITIERTINNKQKGCPPFCIQPMNIPHVKTVAELETLSFIKNLKEKKLELLIDIRENQLYKQETIPGAINLPASMLNTQSKYFNEILQLLGATKINKRWQFQDSPMLLIFGSGVEDIRTVQVIKQLLKLNYPSHKILYYRGGIKSWKSLGLTLL